MPTEGDPADEHRWVAVSHLGLPPGQTARARLSARDGGAETELYDEGWPLCQREGRPIGRARVTIHWVDGRLSVLEDGRALGAAWPGFGFSEAWLCLQTTTHSNYPVGEVFFDDVFVSPVGYR